MSSNGSAPVIAIKEAAAAAIVSAANLPEALLAEADTSQKFVVHPHVATVSTSDRLLLGYLRKIYAGRRPLATAYPAEAVFAQLDQPGAVASATRTLASGLAQTMSRKHAKAGILFGFIVELEDGTQAHGVIKADLDDEQRFHFVAAAEGSWTLDEVTDILPPPRAEFAKFAIAPQPNGLQPAGIRDLTDNEAAAEYFLEALGLTVPKTSGTQAAVAAVALDAGYTHDEIRAAIDAIEEPVPIDVFVQENFPRVPGRRAERLRGSNVRPTTEVRPDDPYIRVYRTSSPYFELSVDETVQVRIQGRVVTVTLPVGSDTIVQRARP